MTIEEFYNTLPFKIGDKVKINVDCDSMKDYINGDPILYDFYKNHIGSICDYLDNNYIHDLISENSIESKNELYYDTLMYTILFNDNHEMNFDVTGSEIILVESINNIPKGVIDF